MAAKIAVAVIMTAALVLIFVHPETNLAEAPDRDKTKLVAALIVLIVAAAAILRLIPERLTVCIQLRAWRLPSQDLLDLTCTRLC